MRRPRLGSSAPVLAGASCLWALLLAPIVWRYAGKAGDDVYITYRYVQNLVQGNGFVFNPGEKVFGVTDPGTALLIALVHVSTGLSIPVAGTVLSALALLAVAVVLLAEAAERDRVPEALAGGTLLLTSPYVWFGQGTGPIFALALLLVAARRVGPSPPGPLSHPLPPTGRGGGRRDEIASEAALLPSPAGAGGRWGEGPGVRGLLAGVLAGLAFWCRPDAALGAILLGLLLGWRERRPPWAYALGCAAVALAGCAAAWSYFGTVVPNTLAAKQHFAALPDNRVGAVAFWGAALGLFRHFAGPLSAFSAGLPWLGLLGQWPLFRSSGLAGRLLVLHSAALFAAYSLLEVPFFIWYTIPTAIAWIYGACQGGGWALRALRRWGAAAGRRRTAALLTSGAVVLLALTAGSWFVGSYLWWRQGGDGDWRFVAYTRAGRWIKEHSGPRADVAAEEIGFLAYASERRVYDLIGLVSPEAMPYTAQGDLVGAFLVRPARFVIFHTFTFRGGTRPVVSKPWFARAYRQAARFDFPELGGSIVVYRRRPGAALPPPRPPHRKEAALPAAGL